MRKLRNSTILSLQDYVLNYSNDKAVTSLPKQVRELLSQYPAPSISPNEISLELAKCLGDVEVKKLLSRMTSKTNRKKFGQVNITINGDTKVLLDKKLSQLGYDSIDNLLHDALSQIS